MRLALPLVLASQLTAPSTIPVGKAGTLMGRVLPQAGGGTAAKALWIGDVSTPVTSGGWFRVTGVPSGPNMVFVETSAGLYAVSAPVTVAPGTVRSVQLALSGPEDSSPPAAPDKEKSKKRTGIWASPASATLIIIGSAIIVGVAVDQLVMSSDDEASPFVPSASTHP